LKNGCLYYDSVYVSSYSCHELTLPNIFTPNNDGLNDVFRPIVKREVSTLEAKIYTRWGVLVYSTEDPDINWKGAGVIDGVYFWRINYSDLMNKRYNQSGWVELSR